MGMCVRTKTNEYVREMAQAMVGEQEPLLAAVKRRKLAWFGHIIRHDCLSKTIFQGTLGGSRRRGRPRKSLGANAKEWMELGMQDLLDEASQRQTWKHLVTTASLQSPLRSKRSRD